MFFCREYVDVNCPLEELSAPRRQLPGLSERTTPHPALEQLRLETAAGHLDHTKCALARLTHQAKWQSFHGKSGFVCFCHDQSGYLQKSQPQERRSVATMICSNRLRIFSRTLRLLLPYRVGSVNFSRQKLGHAHDNSTDSRSENVAGEREPSVHAHFIFRFENGQENQSLFSTHDQNTAETSQPKAQPTDG